jgi:hypothetical protein
VVRSTKWAIQLLGNAKPDFLVHIPGRMNNLLVVEVKPRNAAADRIVADLKKLATFRAEPTSYHAAYMLIYGVSAKDWPQVREGIVHLTRKDRDIDLGLVSCLVHQNVGEYAQFV